MFFGEQIAAFFQSVFAGLLALIVMAANNTGWYLDVGGIHGLRVNHAYTFAYSAEKIRNNDILGRMGTIRLTMGKNEREGCQFILRQRYFSNLCTAEFSDFTGPGGAVIPVKVYREHYIFAGTGKEEGMFPDALIPYANGTQFTLPRQTNQGFYIELRTDSATPAGVYSATVTVPGDKDSETIKASYSVEVVDVTFPDAAYDDTCRLQKLIRA